MPELPDIESFSRLVRDHCRDRTIAQVVTKDPGMLQGVAPDAVESRLAGAAIRSSARYGKHLFILTDRGMLAMHFGTNGSLQLVPQAAAEPSFTRLRLNLGDRDFLAYVNPRRLGGVSLCDSVEEFVARQGLGPDVLDPAFAIAKFASVLAGSKRDIKTVLMDQRLMSGIGNIYSDEILFQARINPKTAARQIRGEQAARLFQAMHETLRTAIDRNAGSEQGAERLPPGFLLRQRHQGGHCPRCGDPLATVKQGGRTGYYCPHCQQN